jgi:hypothetical protein
MATQEYGCSCIHKCTVAELAMGAILPTVSHCLGSETWETNRMFDRPHSFPAQEAEIDQVGADLVYDEPPEDEHSEEAPVDLSGRRQPYADFVCWHESLLRYCPVAGCDQIFKRTRKDLLAHLDTDHHRLLDEDRFKCPRGDCGTRDVVDGNMVGHLLNHMQGRESFDAVDSKGNPIRTPFACRACWSKFTQIDNLDKHLRSVTCENCRQPGCGFQGNRLSRRAHEIETGHIWANERRGAPRRVKEEERVKKGHRSRAGGQ